MIEITFDNWATCHTGSAFKLKMPAVPRAGGMVLVHESHLPKCYKEGPYRIRDEDGVCTLTVKVVEYAVAEDGACEVCIDFKYRDEGGILE